MAGGKNSVVSRKRTKSRRRGAKKMAVRINKSGHGHNLNPKQEGREAWHKGVHFCECSYEFGTEKWRQWRNGMAESVKLVGHEAGRMSHA